MAAIYGHPAPGLGNLLPGFFVVPQNPISDAKVTTIPRIGEILPACFVVPQNPLRDFMQGQLRQIARDPNAPGVLNGKQVGGGVSGCGCSGGGCAGGCGGGLSGISEDFAAITDHISNGEVMEAIQSPVFGLPLWMVLGGAVAVSWMMAQPKGRR